MCIPCSSSQTSATGHGDRRPSPISSRRKVDKVDRTDFSVNPPYYDVLVMPSMPPCHLRREGQYHCLVRVIIIISFYVENTHPFPGKFHLVIDG